MASDDRPPTVATQYEAQIGGVQGGGIVGIIVRFLPVFSATASRLSQLIALIVAARLLSPDRFGAFAVLSSVGAIVVAVVIGGSDMWLNRFSRRDGRWVLAVPSIWPHYIVTVLAMAALVALAEAVIDFGTPWMSEYGRALILAVAGAVIAGITEAMLALYRASGRTGPFFVIRDLGAPLLILSLFVILKPGSVSGVFRIILVVWSAMFLSTLVLFLLNPGLFRSGARLRVGTLWRTLKHTGALIYGNLSSRFAIYIAVFALAFVTPLATVGTYQVAAQLAIGFTVAQHYMFLALPWQLRHIGTLHHPGTGHAAVVWRQRLLVALAFAALVPLFFGGRFLLELFGPNFESILPALQGLLLLRFGELLWGPQHEILISNGRVLQDAHVNIAAIAVWIATFVVACSVVSPVSAAVIAVASASICTQASRRWVLAKAKLRTGAGHGFGPALPFVLTVLGPIVALMGE